MPKGIPKSGKRAPGAGRPPLGFPIVGVKVWLPPDDVEYAKRLGNNNLSAGVRKLVDHAKASGLT